MGQPTDRFSTFPHILEDQGPGPAVRGGIPGWTPPPLEPVIPASPYFPNAPSSPNALQGDAQQNLNTNPGKPDVTKEQKTSFYSFMQGQYPSHYYLELFKNPKEPAIDSVVCPLVNSIQMSQPLAVARTWTFDGAPYEEHSGFQQRTFTISGRSGYSFAALSRFAKFRNFFEKYASLSAENKNAFVRGDDVRLALNFPWEGEGFWCTLLAFTYVRSTNTSRVSYEYQIVLVTNGVVAHRWDEKNGLTYMNCDKGDGCHESNQHWCKKRADDQRKLMPADVYDDLAPYEGPYLSLDGLVLAGSQGGNRNLEPDYWQRVWYESNSCFDKLYYNFRALPDLKRKKARFSVTTIARWLVDIRLQAEVEIGRRGISIDKVEAGAHGYVLFSYNGSDIRAPAGLGSPNNTKPSYRADRGRLVGTVMVSSGEDTVYDIAGRYLGDRNLWLQVVRLNGMLDARTKADGSPLVTGDQLLIPRAAGVPDIGEVYGTGFLIKDGDLVVEGDEDIVLVSGFDNFYQNLRHRLMTTKGENRPYPNFGLPPLIGTIETTDVPSQVLRNVKAQVLADHRVSRLTELTLEESGDTLKVDFAVETAVEDKVRQSFEYPM